MDLEFLTTQSLGGAEWIGELEDYVPNGQGTYIYKNGDKYVGEVHRWLP